MGIDIDVDMDLSKGSFKGSDRAASEVVGDPFLA